MYLRNIVIFVGSALLAGSAYGAVRVYNPETGQSESAPTLEGAAKPVAPSITTAPKPRQSRPVRPVRRAPVQPILLPSEIEAPVNDNLGEAYFFIESGEYNPTLMKKLKQIQGIEGLVSRVYIPAKDPKQYLREIATSKHLQGLSESEIKKIKDLDVKMSVDSDNASFREHRPGGWQRVVYYTPENSRRVYKLPHGIDKLLRHVKRIRDGKNRDIQGEGY